MIELDENKKWIKGYEGRYYVTRDSEVYSTVRKDLRKMEGAVMYNNARKAHSYRLLCLTAADGVASSHYLHRLVAEAFIPNPHDKLEVNHIDGVKTNNEISNLEWVTRQENTIHAFAIGLMDGYKDLEPDYRDYLIDQYITSKYLSGFSEKTLKNYYTKEDFERNGVPYDISYFSQSQGRSFKEIWVEALVIFTLLESGMVLSDIGKILGYSYNTMWAYMNRSRGKELRQIYEKYKSQPNYVLRHLDKIREQYNGNIRDHMVKW